MTDNPLNTGVPDAEARPAPNGTDGPPGGASSASAPPPPPPPPPAPSDPAAEGPGESGQATTPPHDPRPADATVRLFRRSSDDKVIAGVCGGLGRATNIDPIVYRVLAVVLAFFGGAGVLLYVLGWLLLPEDTTDVSLTERALGRDRGQDRTGAVVLAAILVLVAALAVGGVVNSWAATVLVLLVAGGLFLLLRRDGHYAAEGAPTGRGGMSYPTPAAAGAPTAPGTSYPVPAPAGAPTTPGRSYPAPAAGVEPGDTAARYSTPSAETAGPGGPSEPPEPPYGGFAPPPTPPANRRGAPSVLGPLTVSVLLISLGVLAAVDASGASVPASAYPALALLVIGLGLLLGTWYGRSRALIVLGLLAALALPPTIAADVFHRNGWWGDWRDGPRQLVTVAEVGAIRSGYEFHPGRAELDLTGASFTDRTVRTQVDMPAGQLEVHVPQNVDVVATVDLRAGDAVVFGRHRSGLGISERVEDLGTDGRGGGMLEMRIDQGMGSVEVRREAA